MSNPTVFFSSDEADAAGDEWGFNCGPCSICVVAGLTPAELRPHLQTHFNWDAKRYTNPTMMLEVLKYLGVKWQKRPDLLWPDFGLVRVQWAGPWTKPGVPIRARYRHTHWVASCVRGKRPDGVFDVNAMKWIGFEDWAATLVPWLLRECEPKASGEWWVTHSLEVGPDGTGKVGGKGE